MLPDEIHWVRPDLALKTGENRRYLVRIRYRQPLQGAVLYRTAEGGFVVFDEPQRGVTAGSRGMVRRRGTDRVRSNSPVERTGESGRPKKFPFCPK